MMRREWSLHEVHGYTAFGLVDATFDTRLHDDDAPKLERLEVLKDADHLVGRLVLAWEAAGNAIPAYQPPEHSIAEAKVYLVKAIDAGLAELAASAT